MSEQKKPEAGEFWENKERVQIVGTLSDGVTVGETLSGSIRTFSHENGWQHLPDCDSFDWQPQPVESPDDWVILDPVVYADFELRKGIDFINYGHGWDTVDGYDGTPIREFILHEKNQVRCRRRDLPTPPQESPQPNYVRLWTHRTSGTVCSATDARYLKYPDIWTELKHDGTGFYLEDGK